MHGLELVESGVDVLIDGALYICSFNDFLHSIIESAHCVCELVLVHIDLVDDAAAIARTTHRMA